MCSALNPVIEAVTDNKCLDILAQSAEQCKCFLILFFAARSKDYILKYNLARFFAQLRYYTAQNAKNQTIFGTPEAGNYFHPECFAKDIDKQHCKMYNSCRNLIFPY